MKTLNKYQSNANSAKLARIANGELTQITDHAIAEAREAIASGAQPINAESLIASENAMNRYIGAVIGGTVIHAETSAKVILDFAAREIQKLGIKLAYRETLCELDRIDAVKNELNLTDL